MKQRGFSLIESLIVGHRYPNIEVAHVIQWSFCGNPRSVNAGYNFSIVESHANSCERLSGYEVHAVPQQVGQSGQRGFCSDRFDTVMTDLTGGTNCTTALQ